jgi:hypothetical protein
MAIADPFSQADLPLLSAVLPHWPAVDIPLRLARETVSAKFPLADTKALVDAILGDSDELVYADQTISRAALVELVDGTPLGAKDATEVAIVISQAIADWLTRPRPTVAPVKEAETFTPPLPADWPLNWGRVNPTATAPWPLTG